MTCSSKVTISLEAWKIEEEKKKKKTLICIVCLQLIPVFSGLNQSCLFTLGLDFMEFSDPAVIHEEPNWTLLLGKGQGKSDPRSHLHRRAGNEKKTTSNDVWQRCCRSGLSPHFCHLHDVGKLCQTGDGDHIVVGFQFVPAEIRTHMKLYDVGKHSYQLGRRWSWKLPHPGLAVPGSLQLNPLTALNTPSVILLWERRLTHSPALRLRW